MDINSLFHYACEVQESFSISRAFLFRSYLLLRKANPLVGDGIALLGGAAILLAGLEISSLVLRVIDGYIKLACGLWKLSRRISCWVLAQGRKAIGAIVSIWQFARPDAPEIPSNEVREILEEIVLTDGRQRLAMKDLLARIKIHAKALGLEEALIERALAANKGTQIKECAKQLLNQLSQFDD